MAQPWENSQNTDCTFLISSRNANETPDHTDEMSTNRGEADRRREDRRRGEEEE